MEIKAVTKYVRISPRKTRLVADMIRGRNAMQSVRILEAVNKRAAKVINKTLNSAISNARNKEVSEEGLKIKRIFVDGGPVNKRFMPRAMGRATMIKHPTSHITIILTDEGRNAPRIVKKEKNEKKKSRLGERFAIKKRVSKEDKPAKKKTESKKETKKKQVKS